MSDITVFLTPLDAELFKQFQKNYHNFSILEDNKVFNLREGNITINVHDGIIKKIMIEELVYKEKLSTGLD